MLRNVLLSTAALALVATAANAGPKVSLSQDHRYVSVMPSKDALHVPYFSPTKYEFSTIDHSKVGAYFCCFGNTVTGPSNNLGLAAYGVAEQFVATKSTSITKLAAAVGYVSGDKTVTLTLYADNNNQVGSQLAQGTATPAAQFGSCCGVTTAKIPSTSLKSGTAYWIGITATGNTYEAAPFQVYNEVSDPTYVAGTSNGGTSWGSSYQATLENPAVGVK